MNIYIITYDLNNEGKDYTHLIKEIKSLGIWAKPLKSAFIVKTSLTTTQISQRLNPKIDGDDGLFICQLVKNATGQMTKEFWAWFNAL